MRDELDTPASDEPFALRALAILRRRAVLAFAVFAVTLVASAAVALSLPDLFRSSAVVLVERQLPETVVRPAVAGELESRLHVIRQEILSRARLTDLIKRFDLYPDIRRTDMERAIEQVRRDIEIELTGPEQVSGRTKTVAFNLSFTGARRETVADVTNAIADFYISQNTQMRSEEAARTTQFLRSQIEATKAELDRDEQQVKAYTSRHVGELPQQVDVNLATLERLNTQLRINSERQLRTLEQRDRMFEQPTAVAPPQPPPVSPEDARLRALKRDLAQLDGFPDKHPDVRRLKDAIAALEAETKAAAGAGASGGSPEPVAAKSTDAPVGRARTIASLDTELEALKGEEARLRQTIADLERRLEAVPYRQSEFSQISRDHQATREQYDSLLKRYEEARIGQNMEAENQGERFRVLEAAVPPAGPTAPNRPRLLLMGLFLAGLMAALAVLAVEQIDTSFHSVDDLRQFTNLPVLAAIPRLQPAPGAQWARIAVITASMLAGFVLVGTVSAHVARDNEPLVRLLVRGG
jgi:polysaccharide chain length determinant protein (PEP-CTERM system associated)